MITDNLFEFLDEIQKLALKAKVQNILDMSVKNDRVHDVLNADVVIEYYTKMHEHYEKNPKDFLFPNREWLTESLERLGVDLSNVFDECANVDHIKREEVIVLFILLWIYMVIQNPIRIEVIKDPYDLFYIWTKNRVFIARPTEAHYLQDGDCRVLDRLGKSYGWFTGVHHFSIGLKGAVEYHYSSPDDITNINGAYNKVHGSVKKLRDMNDWAMSRLTKEQQELADADKRHWEPEDDTHKSSKVKLGWSKNDKPALIICKQKKRLEDRLNGIKNWGIKWAHNPDKPYLSIPYNAKKAIKDSDVINIMTKLNEDFLKEQELMENVRHRNTKFVIKEFFGFSNKEYKAYLKEYNKKDELHDYHFRSYYESIIKLSGLDVDTEFILESMYMSKLDSKKLIAALLKLKEKINEEKDQ